MPADVFGDLQEWGEVLKTLDELRTDEALDNHQSGLARLIRCQDNWRLREEALIAAADVRRPCSILVTATLRLLDNQEESLENRVLAAQALGAMLSSPGAKPAADVDIHAVLTRMQSLLSNGGPPVLHAAVRGACTQVTTPRC